MKKTEKTVLVTGGSSGIGRGIALAFAREGYRVAITYGQHRENAEESARLIREASGRECVVIQAHLEQEPAAAAMVAQAVEALGRLEVLVNNAGRTIYGHILDVSLETINHLINLNFKSVILGTQAAAVHMKDKGIRGAIVNTTSVRGKLAHPEDGVYGGLKAALERATRSHALDLAPYGIRVNCIAPGATAVRESYGRRPDMQEFASRIPLQRMGTPEDMGRAAVWLCSEKASYITGQTLTIDGGLGLPGMPERTGDSNDWGKGGGKYISGI